jgi:GntR family transcriptional regulator
MIPFRLSFRPGVPIHEQVVYAAKKAIVSGILRPGTPFPSVRALSVGLKINPNTAHKVVAELTAEGLLEVTPGIGTTVTAPPSSTAAERKHLLGGELERLVVEAKKFGVELDDLLAAVTEHWQALRHKESQEEFTSL